MQQINNPLQTYIQLFMHKSCGVQTSYKLKKDYDLLVGIIFQNTKT